MFILGGGRGEEMYIRRLEEIGFDTVKEIMKNLHKIMSGKWLDENNDWGTRRYVRK